MKSLKIILAAASVLMAATDAEKKGAGVVFEYNVLAEQGSTYEQRTLCYYRNGMYFTFRGNDYVIDVEPLRCKYKSVLTGNEGEALCLTYKGTSKSKRLCDCTPQGELKCQK